MLPVTHHVGHAESRQISDELAAIYLRMSKLHWGSALRPPARQMHCFEQMTQKKMPQTSTTYHLIFKFASLSNLLLDLASQWPLPHGVHHWRKRTNRTRNISSSSRVLKPAKTQRCQSPLQSGSTLLLTHSEVLPTHPNVRPLLLAGIPIAVEDSRAIFVKLGIS